MFNPLPKIQKKIDKSAAVLVTDPANLYYLSGFTGTKAYIVITKNKTYFLTDARYLEYAKKLLNSDFQIIEIKKGLKDDWKKFLKSKKIKEIQFDEYHLTYAELSKFRKLSSGVGIKYNPSKRIIEKKRTIKNENEIKTIKKAQQINEQVLTKTINYLKKKPTEKDVEWFIIKTIHDLGGDGPSFNPIVAFGKHSSIPHHQNTDYKLKKGDVVLLDMGVKYKGYCSDMTRTFFTKPPNEKQKTIYQTVLNAQKIGLDSLKSKEKASNVYRKSFNYIESAGCGEFFTHGLGHGVGLNIHESPSLQPESKEILKENMLTTIEPGIYIPGEFGIRIEDIAIIKQNSYQNITKFKKELKDMFIQVK